MIFDGSELVSHFDRLRSEGVVDLLGYIAANPEFLDTALAGVRIKEVNPRSLQVFHAATEEEFFGTVERGIGSTRRMIMRG